MNVQVGLSIMFLVSGMVMSVVALPLMRGRIPRNGIYGFRVPKTLSSDAIWYPANRFMGEELFKCGLFITGGSLILTLVALILPIGLDIVGFAGLFLTMIPLLVAVVRGFKHLSKL